MISARVYQEQIVRIENAHMYTINEAAVKSWKKELDAAYIEDVDLKVGIDYILNNPGKFSLRPHLGNLLEFCGKAKGDRWAKEEAEKKSKLITEFDKIYPTTEHGKKSLSLIKLFLQGSYNKDGETHILTPRDKVDYMLKMEEYYPNNGWSREAMKLAKHYGIN